MKGTFIFLIINSLLVTFTVAQPIITSFSPMSGSVGTLVTINGTSFNSTPSNNVVFFGATRAVVSASTTTNLSVLVPIGATYQNISVTDLSNSLTGYSFSPFDVTFSCAEISVSSFSPPIDFTSASYAGRIALGDIDGDGMVDIAVGQSGIISILRNNSTTIGVPSFDSRIDYSAGSPAWIAIGDLDGDGKQDVIGINDYSTGKVSVYKNNSSIGVINLASRVDYNVQNSPLGGEIVDLDNDGKPEIVVVNYNSNSVSVLKNMSTFGTIAFAPKIDFATYIQCNSISVGDFDGDQKIDLAVASINGQISVLKNTSITGTISFLPKIDYYSAFGATSISSGDIDGDGRSDLTVSNSSSVDEINVLRNISSGGTINFDSPVSFILGYSVSRARVGDLDGDQKLDIVVAMGFSSKISVLKNTSLIGAISFSPKLDFPTGSNPQTIAIGDIDGDGKSDLAIAIDDAPSNYIVSILKNLATFDAPFVQDDSICGVDSIVLNASGASLNENYKWYDSLIGGVLLQTNGSNYNTPMLSATTTFYVTKYDTILLCESNPRTPIIVNVNPIPTSPIISSSGTLLSSSSVIGNQWYFNGIIIIGANSQNYIATQNGSYYVIVTNNGCSSSASMQTIINDIGINELYGSNYFSVYPNPFLSKTTIQLMYPQSENSELRIIDVLGKVISKYHIINSKFDINTNGIQSGIYYMQVISEERIVANKKIIIQE
jgi:Ig-like domain CHU_C associated/FG-GAP-like repeat/Secretion system C-terminal sorting domain/IPT/TIG domain